MLCSLTKRNINYKKICGPPQILLNGISKFPSFSCKQNGLMIMSRVCEYQYTTLCQGHQVRFHKTLCSVKGIYEEKLPHFIRTKSKTGCWREIHISSCLSANASGTIENIFSIENRERTVEKFKLIKPVRRPSGQFHVKGEAAVLVPLCYVNGEPSFLFMMRSVHLKKHRGEISFPGGNRDMEDPDLIHTALRETYEEIGLPSSQVDVWGTMPQVPSRAAGTWVTPVVGYCGNLDLQKLKLNTFEVESVFTRTVVSLCDPTNNRSTQFRYKEGPGYTLPVFLGEEHRIWGLTAVILYQLLTNMAPGLYTFKLKHR